MKIDGGRIINDFIEPNKRQYAIPVASATMSGLGNNALNFFGILSKLIAKTIITNCSVAPE